MTRPIDTSAFHLAIAVRDLEKSRAVYQRLFAMTPTLETDDVVLLTTPARREHWRSSESRTLRSTQTRGTIMVFISASSSARKCSVTPRMQSDRWEARSWLRARVRWDLTCSSGPRMATSLNCLSIAVGEPDSSPFPTRISCLGMATWPRTRSAHSAASTSATTMLILTFVRGSIRAGAKRGSPMGGGHFRGRSGTGCPRMWYAAPRRTTMPANRPLQRTGYAGRSAPSRSATDFQWAMVPSIVLA